MTELIKRLRSPGEPTTPYTSLADLCREAADEIERLAQEITYLQGIIVDLDDRLAQAKEKPNAT